MYKIIRELGMMKGQFGIDIVELEVLGLIAINNGGGGRYITRSMEM